MSTQVYPEGILEPGLVSELARFHRLLVIWHPFYETWQVYERPLNSGNDWSARRLYDAVVMDHERARAYEGSEQYVSGMKVPGARWWADKGAPYCLDDSLGVKPDGWFVRWAEQREASRINISPSQWRVAMDVVADVQQEAKRKTMHDRHLAAAEDIRKEVAENLPHGVSRTDALKKIRRRNREPEIRY